MKQPVILLTGGTGLLGQQLIATCISKGYKIIACKRLSSDLSRIQTHVNLSWVDINELLSSKLQLHDKIDYVIHAAGLVSYQQADKEKLFQVNEGLTTKIITWSLEQGVKRFIYISSIAALGKNSKDNIISENTPWSQKQFASNYGKSKKAAEEAVIKAGSKGLKYIILNPSVIIGPANLRHSSAALFKYVIDQKPFYTNGYINFIDVRDVAEICHYALAHLKVNTQYIINAGFTTYKDFFRQVALKLHKRAPAIGVPSKLVLLGALFENLLSYLTNKPPFLSIETAKMAGKKSIYNGNKLLTAIDYTYFSLAESIDFTVTRMKKNEYIKL